MRRARAIAGQMYVLWFSRPYAEKIVLISEPLSAVARETRPYNVEVGRAESGLYVKQLRW
jgi:hypothetical protein